MSLLATQANLSQEVQGQHLSLLEKVLSAAKLPGPTSSVITDVTDGLIQSPSGSYLFN